MPYDNRIAVFTERYFFNLACGGADEDPFAHEEREAFPPATREVMRLMRDRTCRYCRSAMRTIYASEDVGELMLCPTCGYWGGRGTRELGHGPFNARGVLGVVGLHEDSARTTIDSWGWEEDAGPDINLPAWTFEQLLGQLRAVPERLLSLSPSRAEAVVARLLAEVLDCEVRHVGGVSDGGVDCYICAGDDIRSIVQVKWHRDSRRAVGVGLVREIAGTMLARGVPNALLVTTRERLSPAAEQEIEVVRSREITQLGRMEIDAATYSDLIDMLELAWLRLGDDFEKAVPWFWKQEPGDSHGWIWDNLRM